MKKTIVLFLLSLLFPLTGIAYTVDQVPNVHLNDGRRFVSNPDGILLPETVNRLDIMLDSLEQRTTAEVAVVALNTIDNEDIDTFATDLFGKWGIGKKNDNGLLVLLVLDQRRIVFRTGYGLEGVLPDAICKRIQTNYIIPRFKEGNYDRGIYDGLKATAQILITPEAAEEITASPADEETDWAAIGKGYLTLSLVVSFLLLAIILWKEIRHSKEEYYERYKQLVVFRSYLLAGCFLFPLFILFLYWIVKAQLSYLRNKARVCESCGNAMRKLNEEEDNRYLTPQENTEERLNSVDYDVWLCDHCGNTLVQPYESQFTQYTICPHCHSRAYSFEGDHILRKATPVSAGMGEKRYRCNHCHHIDRKSYIIPIIIAGGIGGGRGGRGGGFSSGGFGGGFTGGGGASSGW